MKKFLLLLRLFIFCLELLVLIGFFSFVGFSQSVLSFEKNVTHDLLTYDGFARLSLPGNHNYTLVAGSAQVGPSGDGEIVIIKVDSSGSIINNLVMGKADFHDICLQALELNGNFYFAGYTRSIDTSASPLFTSYLIKTDNNLNVLWQKNYTIPGYDLFFKSFSMTTEGNSFLFCGNEVNLSTVLWNSYIMKTDTAGNIAWCREYSNFLSFDATTIQELYNKDILIAGSVTIGFEQVLPTVLRFDSSGLNLWAKVFNYDQSIIQQSKLIYGKELPSGNLMLAGYSDFPGTANLGLSDYMVYKLDGAGNIIWCKTYGGSQLDWAYGADYNTSTNELLVLGTSASFGSSGAFNGYVVSLDTGGVITNSFITGDTAGTNNVALFNYNQSSSGDYFLSGMDITGTVSMHVMKSSSASACNRLFVSSNFGNGLYPELDYTVSTFPVSVNANDSAFTYYQGVSDTMICENVSPAVIDEHNNVQAGIFCSPNPAVKSITVSVYGNQKENFDLRIFDVSGKTVFGKTIQKNETINIEFLEQGLYFLEAAMQNKVCYSKFIKQ
jgi:hypothetical protein